MPAFITGRLTPKVSVMAVRMALPGRLRGSRFGRYVVEAATVSVRLVPTTGVIGLGRIGAAVAANLARAGHAVSGYDIRPEAAAAVPGVASVGSPAEVARASTVVLVAVVDADQVGAVLRGPDGVAEGAARGTVVVVLSTIAVAVVHELAAELAGVGITLVDAGVAGGFVVAERGGLVTMVGGAADAVATAAPALDAFSSLVLHMGPLGAGMTAKVALNVVSYGAWRASYEGCLLAEHAGIDVPTFTRAIHATVEQYGGIATPVASRGSVAPVTDPDQLETGRHAGRLLRKDLDAARELAESFGVRLPLAETVQASGEEMFGVS
jgi:3-hydroxyisobutyrate dehydrogenase-like beta-hydroxyacid dehydrogenase